ncbi:MFS transporter [Ligilactobacillus salivarius]|uniref:MFS transporter n=1 Tax=Ligilactobacillus salivarius TaxID=1624 RepID=A0ABD7YVV3_9LACO|nr:MFS transporter [Ligilactobacillus salivarius]WHS06943.1 MFS transporter [Ligilactobacillus salivarius]WHS08653.1 MFS transporter [Ligilactobacillus salivarius]WHS14844.1 MFS transporter [Ligilactobacillus salivarius]WHS18257.1 MFS transporter [Ligilactobacillus salivarius]WHS19733.1 MFS transporter [Ligilactobacillus salivarius]
MSSHKRKLVLIIALGSYLLTALDNSLVLTSLTKIQVDLSLNQTMLSWIQDSYALAFGSFILLSGRLGDLYGRRIMMIIALSLFAVSSIVTGISTIGIVAVISRFIQGIGAAILAPTSLAVLVDYFTEPLLSKAIAWYSSIAGLGMSIGLILGGVLTNFLNWRIGFYFNAIIAFGILILSIFTLQNKNLEREDSKLDYFGSIISIVGSSLLVYSVNGARNFMPVFLVSLLFIILFILVERKIENPILPLILMKNKIRFFVILSRAFLVAAAMGFYFFVSEYLQEVLHYTPLMAGIAYLPMTVSLFVVAIIVPNLVKKYGNQVILVLGSIVIMFAFTWIVIFNSGNYLRTLLIPEILLGIGQGLALAPETSLAIYHVKHQDAGAVSGILNMFHQLGGALGIAIMVQVGIKFDRTHLIVNQFYLAMIVGLIIAILLIIDVLLLISFKEKG